LTEAQLMPIELQAKSMAANTKNPWGTNSWSRKKKISKKKSSYYCRENQD
jgi:hypothetical protein